MPYICKTCPSILSWSLPSASLPTIKILASISNTLGTSPKILSILCWNILPAGATLNGILHTCTCQIDMQKLNNFVSSFRVWYPELTQIVFTSIHLLVLGSMSLTVGPLWTSLINVWLSLAGSEHMQMVLFGLHAKINLFYHSDVSTTHSGTIIQCCCILIHS